MTKAKILVLGAALALPLASFAQPAAQDWEIIIGGQGGASSADFDNSSFGANLSLGYFLNDNVEVGARQSFGNIGNSNWNGATRGFLDYNIHLDKFVPFIGANIGYSYYHGGTDSWSFGPEAGLKYYVQSKAFLFGMAEYDMPFRGRTFKDGNWIFSLGIGVDL
jgi:outer membrane scaffolding protein for murein synthesis (MipA/OmpV family)